MGSFKIMQSSCTSWKTAKSSKTNADAEDAQSQGKRKARDQEIEKCMDSLDSRRGGTSG